MARHLGTSPPLAEQLEHFTSDTAIRQRHELVKRFQQMREEPASDEESEDAELSTKEKYDKKLSLLKQAQQSIIERTRDRFRQTVKNIDLQRRTKPQAPQSLQDLEHESPHIKSTRFNFQKGRSAGGQKEELEEELQPQSVPFLVNPSTPRDVKSLLLEEIRVTGTHISTYRTRTMAPRSPPSSIPKLPLLKKSELSAGAQTARVRNPSPPKQSAVFQLTQNGNIMSSFDDTLAVNFESSFRKDPKDFQKIQKEDKHYQRYHRGQFSFSMPSKPEFHTAQDVKNFLGMLNVRSHDFNLESIKEIERVRKAHEEFRAEKVANFEKILADPCYQSAPSHKILLEVNAKVGLKCKAQDHGERLNVYYEHLDGLHEYVQRQLLPEDQSDATKVLGEVLVVVKSTNGFQDRSDFDEIVGRTYPPHVLLLHRIEVFLSLVAPMFGLLAGSFKRWLRDKRERFEPRDMQETFREVQQKLGEAVSNEAKLRLTIYSCRGVQLPSTTKPAFSVTVSAEAHTHATEEVHNIKPEWQKHNTFLVHVFNEKSPIKLTLINGDDVMGEGSIFATQYSPGTFTKRWIPTRDVLAPHADVHIGVELFDLQAIRKDQQQHGDHSPLR